MISRFFYFEIKGGATGGGWSQVIPMEDINLPFSIAYRQQFTK